VRIGIRLSFWVVLGRLGMVHFPSNNRSDVFLWIGNLY
jgi:hypothetical protein